MNNIKKLNKWANAHTYFSLDLVRIALGIILFYKGIYFITNTQYLVDLLAPVDQYGGGMILFHYISEAHIVGGILIVFGLLTRWAIMAQLPILLGAVLINVFGEMHSQNLLLSIITLAVCLFFLIYGSGKHSADYYFKMEE